MARVPPRELIAALIAWCRRFGAVRRGGRLWRRAASQLHKTVWVLDGVDPRSGERLIVAFSGQLENKNYLSHLLYEGRCRETPRRAWRWQWRPLANGRYGEHIAIVESERQPQAAARIFHVPCWVGGEIAFAESHRLARTSGHVKADLRRIRKHRLTYAIERSPVGLWRFYEHMYLPYMRAAYGARAFVTSRDEFASHLGHMELIQILRDGEPVAGGIVLYEGDRARGWCIGVKDGDRRHLRDGAIGALYHYEHEYLAAKGYDRVHVGASRPFLDDGVLCFKRKWGMRVVDRTPRWFELAIVRPTRAVAACLARHPFIYERGGRLYAAMIAPKGAPPTDDALAVCRQPGLGGLFVLREISDAGGCRLAPAAFYPMTT